jgi:hypothetical protein
MIKITNMKLQDKVVEAIFWVFSLFLCCIALPLAVGLALAIIPFLNNLLQRVDYLTLQHPYIYYGISIFVGICLKSWIDHTIKNRDEEYEQNRKDKKLPTK